MNTLLVVLLSALLPAAPARACDEAAELRRALAQAQADAAAYRRDAAEKAMDEAWVAKDIMEELVSLRYFPGLFDLRDDAVAIKASDLPAYRAVSARLAFLRGAPGATITLKPGKDRQAQFDALKADFTASLQRAGDGLRSVGENPGARQRLWAMAEWGVESSVNDRQVMTRAQKDAVLAAPARDPRE